MQVKGSVLLTAEHSPRSPSFSELPRNCTEAEQGSLQGKDLCLWGWERMRLWSPSRLRGWGVRVWGGWPACLAWPVSGWMQDRAAGPE